MSLFGARFCCHWRFAAVFIAGAVLLLTHTRPLMGALHLTWASIDLIRLLSRSAVDAVNPSVPALRSRFLLSLDLDPVPAAYGRLGDYSYFVEGDQTASIYYWRKSGTPQEIHVRAAAFERAGQPQTAMVLYMASGSAGSSFALGELLARQGQIDQAISAYLRAAEMADGDDSLQHISLGHAYRLQQDWDKAIKHYGHVVRAWPHDANTHLQLGWVLMRGKGNYEAARDSFRRALEAEPTSMWAMLRLGEVHLEQGEFQAAEEWFRRARDARPSAVEPWTYMVVAEVRAGRCAMADELMHDARELGFQVGEDALEQFRSACGETR